GAEGVGHVVAPVAMGGLAAGSAASLRVFGDAPVTRPATLLVCGPQYGFQGMYNSCIPYPSAEPAMEATVAERGQITLPRAVRDALGLTKGSVLKVELDGSRIVLRKNV